MDTDGHGLETNLTEAVMGSAFEVSKVLGAGADHYRDRLEEWLKLNDRLARA